MNTLALKILYGYADPSPLADCSRLQRRANDFFWGPRVVSAHRQGVFVVAAIVVVLVALPLVAFLQLGVWKPGGGGLGRQIIAHLTRRMSVQSVRIAIVMWQIMKQASFLFSIFEIAAGREWATARQL